MVKAIFDPSTVSMNWKNLFIYFCFNFNAVETLGDSVKSGTSVE